MKAVPLPADHESLPFKIKARKTAAAAPHGLEFGHPVCWDIVEIAVNVGRADPRQRYPLYILKLQPEFLQKVPDGSVYRGDLIRRLNLKHADQPAVSGQARYFSSRAAQIYSQNRFQLKTSPLIGVLSLYDGCGPVSIKAASKERQRRFRKLQEQSGQNPGKALEKKYSWAIMRMIAE
jgi:hypothetical protein